MSGNLPPSTFTISMIGGTTAVTPGLGLRQGSGPFAGMDAEQLQVALKTAQQALLSCTTGSQPMSVVFVSGSGRREVVYNKSNANDLRQIIRDIKAGMGQRTRYPVDPGW